MLSDTCLTRLHQDPAAWDTDHSAGHMTPILVRTTPPN